MSEEKCKFYKKQFLSKYCELFKQPCYGKHCNFIKEFTRLNELEQQLQTAKEENDSKSEKHTIQIKKSLPKALIELQSMKDSFKSLMMRMNVLNVEDKSTFLGYKVEVTYSLDRFPE